MLSKLGVFPWPDKGPFGPFHLRTKPPQKQGQGHKEGPRGHALEANENVFEARQEEDSGQYEQFLAFHW